jgi:hypothetical protein
MTQKIRVTDDVLRSIPDPGQAAVYVYQISASVLSLILSLAQIAKGWGNKHSYHVRIALL